MAHDIAQVVKHFQFEGKYLTAEPLPSGHINDSYAAWFRGADGRPHRYLLQRINHYVFRSPERLMQNIEAITTHLRKRILDLGGDPNRETLNLIPTLDNDYLFCTPSGDYWRSAIFIEGAQTVDTAESLDQVLCAARAFGKFQRLVSDFPAGQLHETIPDFHHTPKRLKAFVQAVERDQENRALSVKPEIEFVERRSAETSLLVDLLECGQVPERVTHNDTKLNNVMFDDKTGEGICVIDLDTVMPGLSLYDFGDAVRSGANSAAEDEPNLDLVDFDLDTFDRFAAGYLETTGEFLTPLEIEYLPFSAKLMTLECGLRFLTDHLNGDVYFRIHRTGHNLDRCRTQFKMVQQMEERYDTMLEIVQNYRQRFRE